MSDQGNAPLALLGSNISYFTGKMENYLRLKQIPYRLESMQFPALRKVLEREVEVMQIRPSYCPTFADMGVCQDTMIRMSSRSVVSVELPMARTRCTCRSWANSLRGSLRLNRMQFHVRRVRCDKTG